MRELAAHCVCVVDGRHGAWRGGELGEAAIRAELCRDAHGRRHLFVVYENPRDEEAQKGYRAKKQQQQAVTPPSRVPGVAREIRCCGGLTAAPPAGIAVAVATGILLAGIVMGTAVAVAIGNTIPAGIAVAVAVGIAATVAVATGGEGGGDGG